MVLFCLPILGNWPATSGWLDVSPIYRESGLTLTASPGLVPGRLSLDPNDGITTEALGRYAAAEWMRGRVPWWNHGGGVGLPLAAEGQNLALFFPFVLLLQWQGGLLALVMLLQAIAGVSTYILLRRLACARLAALAGAGLFELNGTFAWFGHGPMMPVAFLPLLVLGVEQARARAVDGRGGGWVCIALALALSLYAGFPETAYLNGLGAGCIALLWLVQVRGAARWRFLTSLVAGATAGVLLAAPFVVPFLHMLSQGDVGGGEAARSFSHLHLPVEGLAVLLLPYVLGPLTAFNSADPTLGTFWLWAHLGGYLGIAVLLLALMGLLGPRMRGLRLLLAGIGVVCLAGTAGVPGVGRVLDLVPLMSLVQFFRYSPPLWEFAAIMLAAFAVDDWLRASSRYAWWPWIAAGVVISVAAVTVALAWRPIALQLEAGGYDRWLWGSLATGLLTVAVLTMLLRTTASPSRAVALLGFLLTDAALTFSVPRLAGVRDAKLDMGAVGFLRENLGLHRFYSLGVIRPNYAAYMGLASVNYDYLPAPRIWTGHIKAALSPTMVPTALTGNWAWPGREPPDHARDFRERLDAYQELGVRYLVTPPAMQPFDTRERVGTAVQRDLAGQPLMLMEEPFQFVFPAGEVAAGTFSGLAFAVATYMGQPTGRMDIRVCNGTACEDGSQDLANAVDNAMFEVLLNRPLRVDASLPVSVSIRRTDGSGPVAIWRWPATAEAGSAYAPDMRFQHSPVPGVPRRVYHDQIMAVFELPAPKPYFEVRGGPCSLSGVQREQLEADCAGPAILVRRELFYPGWRATVGGAPAEVDQSGPIFQSVALPAGRSAVRFVYRPPYARWSAAAALLGLAVAAASSLVGWRRTVPGWAPGSASSQAGQAGQ